MPFKPNSLFGFLRTDRSFHGVDQINEEGVVRDLLLYNIYVPKGGPSAKAAAGGASAVREGARKRRIGRRLRPVAMASPQVSAPATGD